MISAKALFLRRLRSEWRFQYDIGKTVVDWTVALYILVPALYLLGKAWFSWWSDAPVWLTGAPPVLVQSFLLLFVFTGRIRIFVEEADHLFLLRQPSWFRRILAFGIAYSLVKDLLITFLLFLLLSPFLMTVCALSFTQMTLLIGVTLLFRAVMALVRQLAMLRYAGWKRALLFFLLFSLSALLYRSELAALAGPPLAPSVFVGWGYSSILEKPNGPGVPPHIENLPLPASPLPTTPAEPEPPELTNPESAQPVQPPPAGSSLLPNRSVPPGSGAIFAAVTVLAMTALLGGLIRLRLRWRGNFFDDAARERQERLRYAALILNAAGIRFRKPNRRRQRPFAFRRSDALFRQRTAVNVLTEASLKMVLRSRSRLSRYGQMTLLGLFAVTIAPGIWKWAMWLGGIVVMTQWTGYYWKEMIQAEFVQLFQWTRADQRSAAERSLFLLSLPALLLFSATTGFQVFSWLGVAIAVPLGLLAGYVTAHMLSYFGVMHHEQPAREADL
ncbi:hypothetical protein GTO89_06285 [Heliobacterium gestii]|uniref:Uncharacterized protein n=1 Tax=Heliomicrobium gestii TaxID=2699 RepID=A0A845LDW0_HELGE|nr:ABC transporter permease [Heliomicrobium gestii]MBM7866023.1 hypothetical protein [Heliomicrobium gestii]MZP42645.1 hypothetical protein [Heliomicrobium gestii]